jgi:hypothetical protein
MLDSVPPQDTPRSAPGDDTGTLRGAAAWWEPRRLPYNVVLGVIFAALLARTWARISPELTGPNILRLCVLALLANLCYSAAYLVDLPLQAVASGLARARWRWAVWTAGTLFSMLLEAYWYLDEILPPVR